MIPLNEHSYPKANTKKAILSYIQDCKEASRVQISQTLKLSKSTVTENINHLLEHNVVLESGVGSSQTVGGRRPVILRINGRYSYIIAVELSLYKPIFALADLNGEILAQQTADLPHNAPYDQRLRLCKKNIRALLRDFAVDIKKLGVIALSSPGAYRKADDSFQLNPEFINWNIDKLSADLQKVFSTEVLRINDVNAAALGEFYKGSGQNVKSMLFLSCGTGIGYGMMLNGSLYSGAWGSAGEVARWRGGGSAKPLRAHVELDYLLEKVRYSAPNHTRSLLSQAGLTDCTMADFNWVVWLWEQHDEFVYSCIHRIAVILGEITALALSLLNCELVVFGGDFIVFEKQILPIMNEIIRRDAFDPVLAVACELRENAGIHGLLSIAADNMMDRIASGM